MLVHVFEKHGTRLGVSNYDPLRGNHLQPPPPMPHAECTSPLSSSLEMHIEAMSSYCSRAIDKSSQLPTNMIQASAHPKQRKDSYQQHHILLGPTAASIDQHISDPINSCKKQAANPAGCRQRGLLSQQLCQGHTLSDSASQGTCKQPAARSDDACAVTHQCTHVRAAPAKQPAPDCRASSTATNHVALHLQQTVFNWAHINAANAPCLTNSMQSPQPSGISLQDDSRLLSVSGVPSTHALRVLLAVKDYSIIAAHAPSEKHSTSTSCIRAERCLEGAPVVHSPEDEEGQVDVYNGSQCWASMWGHPHGMDVAYAECWPCAMSPESIATTPRPRHPVCKPSAMAHARAVPAPAAADVPVGCAVTPAGCITHTSPSHGASYQMLPATPTSHINEDVDPFEGSIFDLRGPLVSGSLSRASSSMASDSSSLHSPTSSSSSSVCSSLSEYSSSVRTKHGKLAAQAAAMRAPTPAAQQAGGGLFKRLCQWLFD